MLYVAVIQIACNAIINKYYVTNSLMNFFNSSLVSK